MNVLAPLQNNRAPALHQQTERGEHAGRAAAYDEDRLGRMNVLVGRNFIFFECFPHCSRLHAVAIENLAASVERAADNAHGGHPLRLDAQGTASRLPQLGFGRLVAEGKGDFELLHEIQSPYSAARDSGAMSSGANCPA